MRDRHLELHQAEAQDNSTNEGTLLLNPKSDDILPLLFDLIAIDDVESVEKLPHFAETIGNAATELLKFVAHSGSAAMMKLIYEKGNWNFACTREWYAIILAGIDGQNIESLTVLLSDIYDAKDKCFSSYRSTQFCRKLLEHSFKTGSLEVIQAIGTFLNQICEERKRNPFWFFVHRTIIQATARCPEREEYLINAWSICAANATQRGLLYTLNNIAQSTFSIRLARALFQYGVDMNQLTSNITLTPLQCAARHDCVEAAEFMKFLLYQGANPDICDKIREESCVKNISTWLGITWDELIQKVKEDREKGVQWP